MMDVAIRKPIQASVLGSAPYLKNIGDGPVERNLSFFLIHLLVNSLLHT